MINAILLFVFVQIIKGSGLMSVREMVILSFFLVDRLGLANLSVKRNILLFRWQVTSFVSLLKRLAIVLWVIFVCLHSLERLELHLIGGGHVISKLRCPIVVLWTVSLSMQAILGALHELRTWLLIWVLNTLLHRNSMVVMATKHATVVRVVLTSISVALERVSWAKWYASVRQFRHVWVGQHISLILVSLSSDIITVVISIKVTESLSHGWLLSKIHVALVIIWAELDAEVFLAANAILVIVAVFMLALGGSFLFLVLLVAMLMFLILWLLLIGGLVLL